MPDPHPHRTIYCSCCGHTFQVPVYCKNRFCEICSLRRRMRIRHQVSEIIRIRIRSRGKRLRMLTLTIPNYPDPRSGCKIAVASFKKLRKTRFWKSKVSGGAYFLEITKPGGAYHCHLHVLLESEYIPQRIVSELWEVVSPGKIVWVQEIPAGAGVHYVTKYLSKAGDDDLSTQEMSDALRDFRLFQTFGTWHNIIKPLPKPKYRCPDCGGDSFLPEEYIRSCLAEMRSLKSGRQAMMREVLKYPH